MTQQEYENKIKELQDELEQLKAAKVEAEQPNRWKPNPNQAYWAVGCNVTFGGKVIDLVWSNDNFDKWCYLTGNYFKTQKEAEEYKKQIEYTARYKNYIEEHSEPIDWKNTDQWKYYAEIDTDEDRIGVDCYRNWKGQGIIYASSEQIIWDAIEEIGDDNFKKYVLGVK